MHYQLIRTYGEPQNGPVLTSAAEMLQTVRTLLGVGSISQVQTVANEPAYEVYAVANAQDYAQANPAGRLAAAQVSGGELDRELFGPVLIVYLDE